QALDALEVFLDGGQPLGVQVAGQGGDLGGGRRGSGLVAGQGEPQPTGQVGILLGPLSGWPGAGQAVPDGLAGRLEPAGPVFPDPREGQIDPGDEGGVVGKGLADLVQGGDFTPADGDGQVGQFAVQLTQARGQVVEFLLFGLGAFGSAAE